MLGTQQAALLERGRDEEDRAFGPRPLAEGARERQQPCGPAGIVERSVVNFVAGLVRLGPPEVVPVRGVDEIFVRALRARNPGDAF